ncbi:hypothetical protein M9Y10_004037 [Tritrichomonas musculus]|uniref:Protein kinase domain-containing protein n=1 Tax=Tritrichomonas musculus TaxID=1915356 RepID=A0ABR2JQX5_9EUKA
MCDSSIPLPDLDFDELDELDNISSSPKYDLHVNISNLTNIFGFQLITDTPIKASYNSCVYAASSEPMYYDKRQNTQLLAKKYALKISTNKPRILKEFENYQKLPKIPNIVESFDIFEYDIYIILQMELCIGGDIFGIHFEEKIIWKLIHDISKALDALHSEDLIHLDVSPSNILLKNDEFKLADFGNIIENGSFRAGDEGSGPYAAPEVLLFPGKKETGFVHVGSAADIFSFGVVLLEAASGYFAPRGGTILYEQLRKGNLKLGDGLFKCDYSDELITLVNQMINPDPFLRPTAGQIMKRPHVINFSKKY